MQGRIQTEEVPESDIWAESADLGSYYNCGVVWPSPITNETAANWTETIKQRMWACVVAACIAVIRNLLETRQVDRDTIRQLASKLTFANEAEDEEEGGAKEALRQATVMHTNRYIQVTSALGLLEDTRRKGPRTNECPNTEIHQVLSFYVHLMSFDLQAVRGLDGDDE
jgi:hypothetical protein